MSSCAYPPIAPGGSASFRGEGRNSASSSRMLGRILMVRFDIGDGVLAWRMREHPERIEHVAKTGGKRLTDQRARDVVCEKTVKAEHVTGESQAGELHQDRQHVDDPVPQHLAPADRGL